MIKTIDFEKDCLELIHCLYLQIPISHDIYISAEKLECQAGWKDGSRHYMVGKLEHPHATTDEDKFRCFVYEYKEPLRPSEGLFLAQSGDATCNGLFSPHEGSRTLQLSRGE